MGRSGAPLSHHLEQVTRAQFERQTPADAQDDDFLIEVSSLEEILCRRRFDHAAPYRLKASFSSLHQSRIDERPGKPAWLRAVVDTLPLTLLVSDCIQIVDSLGGQSTI